MRILLSGLLFALTLCFECSAIEVIHLKNGFTLEADSHTEQDGTTVLRVGSGTLSLAQSEIGSIELVNRPSNLPSEKARLADAEPGKLLADAAEAYGIEPAFVRSVAQIESGLRQGAISPKGAIGLMQLMPSTAADLQVNPNQPAANASGGARYLRELLLRYRGNSVLALAAYNAGPGAVQKYKGAPPYEETRRYITKVLEEYKKQLKAKTAANMPARKPSPGASKPSATD
ncbi:MAG: lytic transglycosylase domain-containing protein [Bryobacteraceae bacterium]